MKCTDLLISDHKLIMQALQILHHINEDIQQGRTVKRHIIQSLLTFLHEFADGSHHVKEEAILFPALMHAGMRPDAGPLQLMNDEHQRGRALTIAMQDALNSNRVSDFLTYSSRYVELLTNHIGREEDVLFANAELILSEEEDEKVADDFDHFENLTAAGQPRELLHRTLDMLAGQTGKHFEQVRSSVAEMAPSPMAEFACIDQQSSVLESIS